MVKMISRDDALNFEMTVTANPDEMGAMLKGMRLYMDYLKKLPFVDLFCERGNTKSSFNPVVITTPQGEWISEGENIWSCSVCGEEFGLDDDESPYENGYYYCPCCGAKMEETE